MLSAKRLRVSMGTLIAVQATASSASTAEDAIEAAFAAINEVARRLHPRSPGSDLARINNSPPHAPVTVHPSTCALLELARQLNTLTGGVFDPCVPARPGRLQDVEVSRDRVTCHIPVELDFGGFAKGYGVDCAIETLIEHGCSAGLVNAGGDLRVFGSCNEPIFVRLPERAAGAADLTAIALSDAALAVSDATSAQRPPEHQGYYVRANGFPTTNPLVTDYAAVIAKRAVVADALAKCVLLCSEGLAERVLCEFGARRLIAQ